MAEFQDALTYTLINEGGGKYTENPNDNGGPTKYGVTLRTLSSYRNKPCTAADVKALTIQDVTPLYRSLYWAVMRCDDIKEDAIAMAAFDSSVLFGTTRAAKALQSAVNVVGSTEAAPLKVDGRIGPATLKALNAQPCGPMLQSYVTELEEAVTDIVETDAKQIVFLSGWLRRIGAYLVLRFTCATTTTRR